MRTKRRLKLTLMACNGIGARMVNQGLLPRGWPYASLDNVPEEIKRKATGGWKIGK